MSVCHSIYSYTSGQNTEKDVPLMCRKARRKSIKKKKKMEGAYQTEDKG